jgi:hypothetical protein
MEKQTLTFTALPNGFGAGGLARLSVFISPRLWSDAAGGSKLTLDQYPDLLNWPSRVAAIGWQASIDGAPALALSVDTDPLNPLRPELWAALFNNTTQVNPFLFEDYRGTLIETIPIWSLHETIAGLYGRASSDPAYGAGRDRPGLGVLAGDPDIGAIARPSFPEPDPIWNPPQTGPIPYPEAPPVIETPEPEPAPPKPAPKGCLWFLCWPFCWLRKLFGLGACDTDAEAPMSPEPPTSQVAPTGSFKTDVTPPAPSPPPPPGKTFLPPPLTPAQQQTHAAFEALDVFLKPFDGIAPPLPDKAALAEKWDFHQAVASLGDYPAMMRRLGLVVDLLLPAGAALPAAGTIQVSLTGVTWATDTTIVAPRTHFLTTASLFATAPRPALPEVSNGFLQVDDATRFRVVQNDVPGDAVKLRNAATHFLRFAQAVDRPQNMPGEGGLPALRTAGVSLVRRDTAVGLAEQFLRSVALNRFLAAKDLSPEPTPVADAGAPPAPSDELFAEDVVRGYRIDVFDTKTAAWRSLCERNGHYRFLDALGGPADETAEDEGFVQLAVTTPGDPTVAPTMRASESLFTWSGWSLAAPRPGLYIMPDDSHAERQNPAVTPFRIETNFTAKAGSLPRLRFGRAYRLRARVADLAGNSVTRPADPAFSSDPPERTAEFTVVRYEPVPPPILMLRAAPVEGESVERMVVRTPVVGGLGGLTARHVAPPKASQLLAELHGKFDIGAVDGSAAGYALAARESANIHDGAEQTKPGADGLWFQPAAQVSVGYLPDPQARGVALTGLLAAPGPGGIQYAPFDGTWPDLLPFRIDLKAVAAAPAAPAWDAVSRVLTVQLAPAQRATVRINCFIDPGDLDSRGVWKWTEDQAPPNLPAVKNSALAGQHWAHMPWRDLTLLHAVQKPLAAPDITVALAQKNLGETFAIITGAAPGADGLIAVDAPSTGRVQLLARWIDPIDADDPALSAPTSQEQNAHVCEIEVAEGADPVHIIDSGTGTAPKHEFHDTKYHRVEYAPVAVTRFREYFPSATNTEAATTLRGANFAVDVLNSARPAAPKFLYALPLFEWDTLPATPGIIERTRGGGGLRIYLARPWYSSGDGELLGVIFLDGAEFLTLDPSLKALVTQWGADPIWGGPAASVSAAKPNFKNAKQIQGGLVLEENAQLVLAAGYEPVFDVDRQLWRVDVHIDTGNAYWPFVRLALARFQPKSVDGAHLSRVIRSDFIQLPPARHTRIKVSGLTIHIAVDGPAYVDSELIETVGAVLSEFGGSPGSNGLSEIEATIEQRDPAGDAANELAWKPIEATRLVLFQNPLALGKWEGDVTSTVPLSPGLFRLTVKELEWFRTDDAPSFPGRQPGIGVPPRDQIRVARRIVFADVFAL